MTSRFVEVTAFFTRPRIPLTVRMAAPSNLATSNALLNIPCIRKLSRFAGLDVRQPSSSIKLISNLRYTRVITSKRVTSGGIRYTRVITSKRVTSGGIRYTRVITSKRVTSGGIRYTCVITSKRVTSGGIRFRDLASGQRGYQPNRPECSKCCGISCMEIRQV